MQNPFIIGKLIYLRAPEAGDEAIIAVSENLPEPRKNLFYNLPTSVADQKDKLIREHADPNTIILTICSREADMAIGKTGFYRIDWVGRMALFYLAISEPANWQKGFGSEVTGLMIQYAFETLNFNRLQLHVHVDNKAAVKVYKNHGFVIEGTLREAMYHYGRYCDFFVMGILKKEYKQRRSDKAKQ